jgi:hypothetical protein
LGYKSQLAGSFHVLKFSRGIVTNAMMDIEKSITSIAIPVKPILL